MKNAHAFEQAVPHID